MAPPKRNNNLASPVITHNESMRVRKNIRELITVAKRQTSSTIIYKQERGAQLTDCTSEFPKGRGHRN
jgi:hypothetical protein